MPAHQTRLRPTDRPATDLSAPGPLRRRAGLLIVLWLLAGPMLVLSHLWTAPTSAGEDDMLYYFPLRVLVGRSLAQFHAPLWTPYEQLGAPLLADPQAAVFHPATWLFAVLPPKPAYALNVFLAFGIAGAGAYAYLRRIGLRRAAAMFGATAFQYGGFFVGHRVHLAMIMTAAMLPIGLWAIESLRTRWHHAAATLPGILYLALAAGHWPTAVNLAMVWTAYFAVRARPLGRSLLVAAPACVIGVAMVAPQLAATAGLLGESTRRAIGYVTFGENSFLPLSGVLAFFPFVMGCRIQNFFVPQPWWGPWHLCETLGYVGLLPWVFAPAAAWRLWRRTSGGAWSPLVKLWVALGIGAGLWMLGYYLPTYRLVHAIPVLNVVRAPARMLLAVDLALATVAAIGIHALLEPRAASVPNRGDLLRTARRWATAYLPVTMVASLAVLFLAAWAMARWLPWMFPNVFTGTPTAVWQALRADNPALWVPLLVLAVTAATAVAFLRRPERGGGLLVAVLLLDLLIVARHVDIAAPWNAAPDPLVSPAARLVRADAGSEPFRVLHLGDPYGGSPAEILAPKACAVFGIESLASYGPFQRPRHAHLFGLRIYSDSHEWAFLVRRNVLLSLFNVRYLVVRQPPGDPRRNYREVIESVTMLAGARPPDGPDLLSDAPWALRHARRLADGTFALRAPRYWQAAMAEQAVALEPGRIHRIALDVRGPEGADGLVQAEIRADLPGGRTFEAPTSKLILDPDRMGRPWRHFEWTFQAPADTPSSATLRILTMSETPVEIRGVSVRASHWDQPVNLGRGLVPGDRVYRLVAELPALCPGDPPVVVYENRLCLPRTFPVQPVVVPGADAEAIVELLRWDPEAYDLTRQALVPDEPGAQALPLRLEFVSAIPGLSRAVKANAGVTFAAANGLGSVAARAPGPAGGVSRRAAREVLPPAAAILGWVLYLVMAPRLLLPSRAARGRRS